MLVLGFVLAFGAGVAFAEAASTPVPAPAVPTGPDAVLSDDVYGPILSRDPATRARIKTLYVEQRRLSDECAARVNDLAAEIRAETDPDLRFGLHREVATLKKTLEIDLMRVGLEIAQLNEDAARVAAFELALDQLLNPEKYPAPRRADAAAERERALDTAQD
jgi:hypothetical protein